MVSFPLFFPSNFSGTGIKAFGRKRGNADYLVLAVFGRRVRVVFEPQPGAGRKRGVRHRSGSWQLGRIVKIKAWF